MNKDSLTNQTESVSGQYPEFIVEMLWVPSFTAFFQARYQEKLLSELVDIWMRFDTVSNILIALTASGSAIAGWAVWKQDLGRAVWFIFAGFASFLSIIHSSMQVPAKLKELLDFRRQFTRLRIDLETFRLHLKMGYGEKEMLATYD